MEFLGSFNQNQSIEKHAKESPNMPGSSPNRNLPVGDFNVSNNQTGMLNRSCRVGSLFTKPYDSPSLPANKQMPITSVSTNKVIHSCSYCGLVLSSANALVEHTRIHTGDRPFKCTVCGKRFTQKAHLNIHKRTHTGEKPYACHICHKRFAQSSHLTSHKRIHSDEKPFVCHICQAGFTQKQRLDVHLRKHIDNKGQLTGPVTDLVQPLNKQIKRNISDNNILPIWSQEKSYVKHEPDVSIQHCNSNSVSLSQTNSLLGNNSHMVNSIGNDKFDSYRKNQASKENDEESENLVTTTYSADGMFLHPSDFISYSGMTDEADSTSNHQKQGEITDDVNHISNWKNLNKTSSTASLPSFHRRKPSIVRKRCTESPLIEEYYIKQENVDDVEILRKTDDLGNEFKDISKISDAKNNSHLVPKSTVNTLKNIPLEGVNTTGVVPVYQCLTPVSIASSSKITFSTTPKNMTDDLTCSQPSNNSHGNSSLVKVNNRISLVNFTAEELICHVMKREDVFKCDFCCMIFQDAAMYHIHRNMHDKADHRLCNMCGKSLNDKYDFIAHFLSMHKS